MIDKMTKPQLRETAVRMGFALPVRMLRDEMIIQVRMAVTAAHVEALAENGARVVLAEAMDRPWSESVHPRIRAYHAALEGSTAARYDLAAAHRYAIGRLYDEAMIENDARDLRNPDPPSRPLSYDVARSTVPAPQLNGRLSARLETVTERDALGVSYTHWRHAGTNVRLDTEPDGTYAVRVPQMDAPGYAIYADRVSTFVKARRHAGNAVALIREQVAAAHAEAVDEHRRRDADRAVAITLAPAAVAAPSETERIVRRAGYDVLRAITGHIDGWVETCKANAEAMGHRDLSHIHSWLTEDDFRTILADTARELGIGEQWEAGRS